MAVRVHALDMPDARKVHPVPVPRCGGVAMALGALVPIVFWTQMSPQLAAYLAGGAILFATGMYDDFKGLGYQAKFMAQVAAAMVLVLYGGVVIKDLGSLLPDGMLLPDWFATIVTVFVIVGVTNAINLADGLDGLAGGISLLIFLFISYLAYQVGNMIGGGHRAEPCGNALRVSAVQHVPRLALHGRHGEHDAGLLGGGPEHHAHAGAARR